MIAIFAAMESEVAACPEWTRSGERKALGGATVFEGKGSFVCQTGIGREQAQRSVEAALSHFTPSMVLSVGVAGALAPGIEVGDVVVCTHVDHESHRGSEVEQAVYSDQRLLDAAIEVARESDISVRTGTSITVDEAAWGPAEKAAHHAWKSHDIVEMESFWIAAAAVKRGIPVLTVRTVSDTADYQMPKTGAMRDDGTFDASAFQAWAQAHPGSMKDWTQMAENARAAFAGLTRFLEIFLPQLAAQQVR
jgi:adenosylhomocysteine nucleosidase